VQRVRAWCRRHPVVTVSLVAFVVQGVVTAVAGARLGDNRTTDYVVFYEPVARNIAAGKGITLGGRPATYWSPGFPILLAPVVKVAGVRAIMPFLLVVAAATAGCFFSLVRHLFGSERTARIAAAMWVLYPVNLYLGVQPLSEIPFRLAFSAALLASVLAVRRSSIGLAAAAGALLGASMLIRPASLLQPAVLAIALGVGWGAGGGRQGVALGRRGVVASVALVGAAGLVIAPWEVWASQRTGRFVLLSTAGTASALDGLTIGTDADESPRCCFPAGVVAMMEEASARKPELRRSYGRVVRFLADQPPATVAAWAALKVTRTLYTTESGRLEGVILALQLPFLSLMAAGAAIARRRRGTWLLLGVALAGLATAAAGLPTLRQMAPALGLLLALAAIAVERAAVRAGLLNSAR
jgi:hypothetical protein